MRRQQPMTMRLSLLDPATDQPLAELEGETGDWECPVQSQAFGEGDQRIYAVLGHRSVSCWKPASRELVRVLTQANAKIEEMTVSPDERQIATVGHKSAYVCSLPDGKKRLDLKHPMLCTGAAFLPGGRLLTSSYDGLVRVWDLSGGAELHAFDLGMGRVYSLAVSPDQMTFAAGVHKQNRIVLMDVPE
jgi:WD40 repeat protein